MDLSANPTADLAKIRVDWIPSARWNFTKQVALDIWVVCDNDSQILVQVRELQHSATPTFSFSTKFYGFNPVLKVSVHGKLNKELRTVSTAVDSIQLRHQSLKSKSSILNLHLPSNSLPLLSLSTSIGYFHLQCRCDNQSKVRCR